MRNFSTMSFECSICEEMNAQMLIGFSTWWDESKIKYFKSTTWSAFTSSCPIGWNFDGAWLIKILLQITIMEFSSTKMDKLSRSFPQKKLQKHFNVRLIMKFPWFPNAPKVPNISSRAKSNQIRSRAKLCIWNANSCPWLQ